MRIGLYFAAFAAALSLAGCATSGLQAAGKLGDAGAAATLQAGNAYTRSGAVLQNFTGAHCRNYALAANEAVLNQQPVCPYLRGAEPATQAARDLNALRALTDERARLFMALNAYYSNFGATARLDPVKLTDATKSVATIASSLAAITTSFPIGRDALAAAGARVEALVQIIEENHRLGSLRESSADIRAALPVAIATYTVEQSVLRSIAQANANESAIRLRGLSERRLLDSAAVVSHEQQNEPVLPYNSQTQQAWNSPHGRAYILNSAILQDQAAVDQVIRDNASVVDSLQRLIRLHQQFETTNSVTSEDVAVLMSRINVIVNGPAPAPTPATTPAPASH